MIEVYPDLESLSRAAAALLVKQANLAVAARGRFSVALSGGATPRRTYELLAAPPLADQAPWDRVHVFWGDERCVPLDDPRSNARLAQEAWLDHVPIPADQIHPMDCADDPAAAARQYEAQLREFFAGRAPYPGPGPPGSGGQRPHRLAVPGDHGAGGNASAGPPRSMWPRQDLYRVTLTAPLINQAAVVAFLVAGQAKAGVLREVLHGPRDPERLPAQLIQPQNGELLWLTDLAAAAQLPVGATHLA